MTNQKKTVRNLFFSVLAAVALLTAIPALAVDYIGVGKVTGSSVNIREGNGTTTTILGTENYGTTFPAYASKDGWYQISYKGETAWICGSYFEVSPVSAENSRGSVTGDYVNVRSGASTSHSVVTTVPQGETLVVYGEENGWYKVSANGVIGYISGDFFVNEVVVSQTKAATSTGQAIVDEAMRHLGKAYVYGASGPNAFDCSGFTSYIYRQFGYSLNRVAADQTANGTPVEKANLRAGDLLFFSSNGSYISHVGIYIGNNQMIHASTSTTGVIISDLGSDYYLRTYVCARRVAN